MRTYFLCHIANGKEIGYSLYSSVTSCLEAFATAFAKIMGKNTRHLLPNGALPHENLPCSSREQVYSSDIALVFSPGHAGVLPRVSAMALSIATRCDRSCTIGSFVVTPPMDVA